MDQISYSSSSSSSYTSSSTSSSSENHPPKPIKSTRPPYLNALHSVRKPAHKPITKQFIAPLPPTPPKIYKVEASNFKDVVRVLTSTPEFQSPPVRRLKDIAPPPLVLSQIPKPALFPEPTATKGDGPAISPLSGFVLSPGFCKFLSETLDSGKLSSKSSPVMDCFGGLSPLGLGLSPVPPRVNYEPAWVGPVSPLGFGLSPSSLSWCSSMRFSPTTISTFNQSPIL